MKYLFLLLFPFFSLGQTADFDFNLTVIDTVMMDTGKLPNVSQGLQAVYYPDSIPPREWFVDRKDTIERYFERKVGGTAFLEKVVVRDRWANNFSATDYRLLAIYNPSGAFKKIYCYADFFMESGVLKSEVSIKHLVPKLACVLQAKDEKGNWKDLNSMKEIIERTKSTAPTVLNFERGYKVVLHSRESANIMVKPPSGDFETELRYKILVNSPPDYPQEQYIYSNSFRGSIDKLLLR